MFSKTKISGVALATLVAVAFIACGGGSSSTDGLKACNDGDKKACDAIATSLKTDCDKGKGEACTKLGAIYFGMASDKDMISMFGGDYSKVAKPDELQAITLLDKACGLNNGLGCIYIGAAYAGKGDSDKSESLFKKGLDILEKECDSGNKTSCAIAGSVSYEKREYQKASQLFAKVCDKLDKTTDTLTHEACIHLGDMYMNSLGVTQDMEQAKKYYKKVCDGGEQSGCTKFRTANEKSK